MNIKFIGTGTVGTATRNNIGILIDNILLDCGMGITKQIEKYGKKTKDIKYLIITHFHADHFFDIPNLLLGRWIRKIYDEKLYIILPITGRRKIIDLMKFGFGNGNENAYENIEEELNVEFIEMGVNETYNFEDYQLTSIELEHGECIPNYGYLLKKNNITISYTGDTEICDNFKKMCEQSDYMFVEATTFLPLDVNMHIAFEELKELAEKYNNCIFYAVHRGDYEIEDKGNVYVPDDGEEIIL